MEHLYCPFCDSKLEVTHQERYQDLSEHVSDPNGTPSLKDGYECLNTDCLAHGTFNWIQDGDYYSSRPEHIEIMEWRRLTMEAAGGSETFYAVGSWNYFYQKGKDAIKAKTFKIDLHFYKFVFSPKEKGWDYEIHERHMPNMWRWKVEIWKKTSDYGYANVMPFWRMSKYCVNKFNNAYAAWKENGHRRNWEEAYNEAMGISPWGVKDDRFFAKFSKVWIQTFYPKKVKDLVSAK